MFSLQKRVLIYFYANPVDLRKGIEGLFSIASSVENIKDESYVIFLNRKRNRMKLLYCSNTQPCYFFIRSRKGVYAPKKTTPSFISFNEFEMMLDGEFPERLKFA